MNSTFSLKSSIALLVLGVAMLGTTKQPAKSTLTTFTDSQSAIATSAAVGAIVKVVQNKTA